MSSSARDSRLLQLVAAFTEMGPTWVRWVQASIPGEAVSYARFRVLKRVAVEARRPDEVRAPVAVVPIGC
jgi:hypothetical protein